MARLAGSNNKPRSLTKEDWLYAREVAGQKAFTPKEKAWQAQAKADLKAIEKKFPGIGKHYTEDGILVIKQTKPRIVKG